MRAWFLNESEDANVTACVIDKPPPIMEVLFKPPTEKLLPILAKFLIEAEDPRFMKSRMEAPMPTRVKRRSDSVEPMFTQSKTLNPAPNLPNPRTDIEEPVVTADHTLTFMLITERFEGCAQCSDSVEPILKKLRIDTADPLMQESNTDMELPNRAKLLIESVDPTSVYCVTLQAWMEPKRNTPATEKLLPNRTAARRDRFEPMHAAPRVLMEPAQRICLRRDMEEPKKHPFKQET
jgi:hypothetical protein